MIGAAESEKKGGVEVESGCCEREFEFEMGIIPLQLMIRSFPF